MSKNLPSTVTWKGISNTSIEDCSIKFEGDKYIIESSIKGNQELIHFDIVYKIELNEDWQTLEFYIEGRVNEQEIQLTGAHNLSRGWILNGISHPSFDDIYDIDISLSPFTNTLPINRLEINEAGEEISVLYIDVVEGSVAVVNQLYSKVSESEYLFQQPRDQFSAQLEIDSNGLVVNYPELFKRIDMP